MRSRDETERRLSPCEVSSSTLGRNGAFQGVTDVTLGAPWRRELGGRLDRLAIDSKVLEENPLGDPARRPLYVYLPPAVDESSERLLPSIYVIQGLTGQLDMWLNRSAFEPTMVERVDELFSSGGAPPAVVVFVDAWTSYGGPPFINSARTGPYKGFLFDAIVSFIDERH